MYCGSCFFSFCVIVDKIVKFFGQVDRSVNGFQNVSYDNEGWVVFVWLVCKVINGLKVELLGDKFLSGWSLDILLVFSNLIIEFLGGE